MLANQRLVEFQLPWFLVHALKCDCLILCKLALVIVTAMLKTSHQPDSLNIINLKEGKQRVRVDFQCRVIFTCVCAKNLRSKIK